MNNKKVKKLPVSVGIVGCGGIAQVIHLPLLSENSNVRIQAVCDLDTSKAAVVAEKFHIQRVYQDISEMLQNEQIDALFILTPNNLHLPMSLMAIDKGLHLFIEKPAARNFVEAERIETEAASSGSIVMIGMQNRFRPDILAIRKFLTDEELGRLFLVKAGWLQAKQHAIKQPWILHPNISGGGVILDLGVQMIDLIWWLLGKPDPVSVKATSFPTKDNPEVENFCVVYISFTNEVAAILEVSWDFPIAKDRFYLELNGESGIGTLNPLGLQKFWRGQIVNISPEIQERTYNQFKIGYKKEIDHFLNYLTGKTENLQSGINDSVMVLKIVDGIYRSIDTKREITFE